MWQLDNRTPFAAKGCMARDRFGAEHWIVAVRASFVLRPDQLLDIVPAPVRLGPEYSQDDTSSLQAESDIAPFRPRADVLITGTACASSDAAAKVVDVHVRVGALDRRARVFGRRLLRRGRGGRHILEGIEPFVGLPLTWRAALGGPDPFAEPGSAAADPHPENPLGIGWTSRWAKLPDGAEMALPRIEDPAHPVGLGRPLPSPHGLGPVQPGWRPRITLAGTYDEAWRTKRAPLPPVDFSDAFHQAAPAAQVYPDLLRGGETVEVEGLHSNGAYRFRLPQIILETRTRIGRDTHTGRPRLISATIDGTAQTLDLTWNASTPCNGRDHLVEGSLVRLRQMAGVA